MQRFTAAIFMLASLFLINCKNDEPVEPSDDENHEPLTTELRTFIFGHSLIVHDPPLIPTPSDETSVPHWMASLANHANFDFAVAGQYGFLQQHDDLPPIAQWGFDIAEPAWDSDNESFADADFNTVLLTPANFIQYQPSDENYFNGDVSPVGATLTIHDWVKEQEPEITFYVYENWPDMAPFIGGQFPPTEEELAAYHENTQGEFHEWWIDYHDHLVTARPEDDIRMIPVGPIIGKILTETELASIPFAELYEDDAPHGRPTIYFLAGLITYMAMYGTESPADYVIPNTVHELVSTHYQEVVSLIWEELNAFDFDNGESRVW
ncbi:MAG: hypothetical protein ABJG47_16765 [Ekhidna sp.]